MEYNTEKHKHTERNKNSYAPYRMVIFPVVMAPYGHGGKRWIWYDIAQNIAIRYDVVPNHSAIFNIAWCYLHCICNGPQWSEINVALEPSHALECHRRSSIAFERHRLDLWRRLNAGVSFKNLALLDFSNVLTNINDIWTSSTVIDHGWWRLNVVKRVWSQLTASR